MAWYHRFGTPPGELGTLYRIVAYFLLCILVAVLVILAWVTFNSTLPLVPKFIVTGVALTIAVTLVVGAIVIQLRHRADAKAEDEEDMSLPEDPGESNGL